MRSKGTNKELWLAAGIYLVYLLGYLMPEKLWGMHFSAFLERKVAILLLILPLALYALYFYSNKTVVSLQHTIWRLLQYVLPIIAGLLFFYFSIPDDFYGNARNFYMTKNDIVSIYPKNTFQELLSLNITPGQGREGVKLIVDFISYSFQISITKSFIWLNAICGAVFSMVIIQFINKQIKEPTNRFILFLALILSPMLIIYFGHIETYAPVFLLLLIWLVKYASTIKNSNKTNVLILLLFLIIGVRLHTFHLLLLPSLILLGLKLFADITFNLKQTFQYIYIPLLLIGLFSYFFLFKDYNDARNLSDFTDIERLFLPILSPEAPLDKYNLFSFNHLLDFLNIVIFWSPVFILFGFFTFRAKSKIRWNSLGVTSLLLSLAIFISFLFAVNPLLSMPMDWDLFMFPVTLLMVLVVTLINPIQSIVFTRQRKALIIGVSSLCLPAFFTILSAKPNAARIESVGRHIYKTYYEHASTYLLYSISANNKSNYLVKLNKIIADLEPYALPENDKQFSDLLIDKSIYIAQVTKNDSLAREVYLQALRYFHNPSYFEFISELNHRLIIKEFVFSKKHRQTALEITQEAKAVDNQHPELTQLLFKKSLSYYPLSKSANFGLLESYFTTERFKLAYLQAIKIDKLQLSSKPKQLRILIHLALEAGLYDVALQHTNEYLEINPQDEKINFIATELSENNDVANLKLHFRRRE